MFSCCLHQILTRPSKSHSRLIRAGKAFPTFYCPLIWILASVTVASYQLEAFWSFSYALWHQQSIFTGYFLSFGPFSVNRKWLCGKAQVDRQFLKYSDQPGTSNHAVFKITQITFIPHSDAPFELQHLLPCGRLIRYLSNWKYKYENINLGKWLVNRFFKHCFH